MNRYESSQRSGLNRSYARNIWTIQSQSNSAPPPYRRKDHLRMTKEEQVKHIGKISFAVSVIVLVICLVPFVWQFVGIFQLYQSGATNTVITKVREDFHKLPAITLCMKTPFKPEAMTRDSTGKRPILWEEDAFVNATYSIEDILVNESIAEMKVRQIGYFLRNCVLY